MTTRAARAKPWLGAILLSALACAPEPEGEWMHSFGRLDYYTPAGEEVCLADGEYLSNALTRLEEYFGQRPFERVGYHRRPNVSDVCRAEVEACADTVQGQIYSRHPATAHELVHLVADMKGQRQAFLREGLAEALGDDEPLYNSEENSGAAFDDIPYDLLLEAVPESYDVAASYVTNLIRTWGLERFMGFYASVPVGATLPQFEELLAREGTSLGELDTQRKSDASAGLPAGIALLRCSEPDAPGYAAGSSFSGELGCGQMGHRRGLGSAFGLRRVLEIPESERGVLVKAALEDGGGISLAHCERAQRLHLRHQERGAVALLGISRSSEGRHSLSVEVPEGRTPQRASLAVEPFDDQILAIPPEPTKLQVALAPDEPVLIRLELSSVRSVRRIWMPGSSTAVSLCLASACTELLEHETYVAVPGLYELHLRADARERPELEIRTD